MRTRQSLIFIATLLFVPLIIYGIATFYVRFMADDYCRFSDTRSLGVIPFVGYYWQYYTGRVAFLLALSASMAVPLPYPGFPALITLVIWWAALLGVFHALARRLNLPPIYAPIGATLFLITLLQAGPNVVQAVYWQTGMFTYGTPLALFCVLIWVVLIVPDKTWGYSICAFLAIIVGTMGDVMSAEQIIALVFAVILFQAERKRFVAALVGAVIAFVIVAIAPGTAARRDMLTSPGLLPAVLASIRATGVSFAILIRQAPFGVAALVFLPAVVAMFRGSKINAYERRQLQVKLLILLGGMLLITAAAYFTGYYLSGFVLQGRAQSIPVFFTLIGLVGAAYIGGTLLASLVQPGYWLRFAAVTILALAMIGSTLSAMQVLTDLRQYTITWDARDQRIRAGERPIPALAAFGLEDAETDWVLACMTGYYATP